MIVYENKGYETRVDKPNEDWTGDALFVVEDNTPLANKIIEYYPEYDFIVDDDGNLIDILTYGDPPEPDPEPPSADTLLRDTVLPLTFRSAIVTDNGDSNLARETAGMASEALPLMQVRSWEAGMHTSPGELVYDPDEAYAYMYTGKDAMTHNNPLFYPGAAGVYYWAIVPLMHQGHKVYPDVAGIIVAVKNGELWWDTSKDTLYRWIGADNNACVWAPGTAPTLWQKVVEAAT